MQESNSIAIFGGSFNPPLDSHLILTEEILDSNLNIDRVVLVPVSTKYNKEGLVDNIHRYNMLKLMFNENPQIEISRLELDSEKQLYTIETLDIFKKQNPNSNLYFALGTDNLKEFKSWKNPEEILKKYKLIVFNRDWDEVDEIIDENELLKKYKDSVIKLCNIRTRLSSSYIRELIKKGKEVSNYLPEKVLEYIKKNNLYK